MAAATVAPALRLEIQSVLDPACPWCFIGLRRLQRALAASPDVAATVRYVPYVFDPETPSPPLPWRAYVALRYPSRAEFIYTQKLPYTLAQAASEGIALHNYEARPVCPTVDALCLLKAGADAGRCARRGAHAGAGARLRPRGRCARGLTQRARGAAAAPGRLWSSC